MTAEEKRPYLSEAEELSRAYKEALRQYNEGKLLYMMVW